MNREEFLKQLQDALGGRVSDQVIRENVNYYRRYINEQTSSGKPESEVIAMLGNPRLLAKTIEGSTKFASNAKEAQGDYNTFYGNDESRNGTRGDSYNRSDYGTSMNGKQIRIPVWLVTCLVLLAAGIILTIAFRVFVFFAPVILAAAVGVFIYRIVRNWLGKF